MACEINKAIELLSNSTSTKVQVEKILKANERVQAEFGKLVQESYGVTLDKLRLADFSKGFKKFLFSKTRPSIRRDALIDLEAMRHSINGMFTPYNNTITINKYYPTSVITEKVTQAFVNELVGKGVDVIDNTTVKEEFSKNATKLSNEVSNIKELVADSRSSAVLLHALVHSASVAYMSLNPNEPATQAIKDIYQYMVDNHSDISSNEYWKESPEEFLAEALSDPELMTALMQLKPDKPTSKFSDMFSYIQKLVISTLGFNKDKSQSIFDVILGANLQMLEAQGLMKPKETSTKLDNNDELIMKDSTLLANSGNGKYNLGIKEQVLSYINSNKAIKAKLTELGIAIKDC